MTTSTERVKRLVLAMESGNAWNDAAPACVVLDIDPAHVIESLSRLESPCQAFARTLPDRCHEFNFEPPFNLVFGADWRMSEQVFSPAQSIALVWLPVDFRDTLAQSEVACQRAEWDGGQWIVSGLIGDSDDRTLTPPFRTGQLVEAVQRGAMDVTLTVRVLADITADFEADDDLPATDAQTICVFHGASDLLARVDQFKETIGHLNWQLKQVQPVVAAALAVADEWGDGQEATGDERLTTLCAACAQYRQVRAAPPGLMPMDAWVVRLEAENLLQPGQSLRLTIVTQLDGCEGIELESDPNTIAAVWSTAETDAGLVCAQALALEKVLQARGYRILGPTAEELVVPAEIALMLCEDSGQPVSCVVLPGSAVDARLLDEVRDLAEYYGQAVVDLTVEHGQTLAEVEAWVRRMNADVGNGDEEAD